MTFTILFGLLLIYALCMMIIPQLITSVTTLYYTAQANITKFMYWANHLEFIEKNEQIMELLNSAYAALNTNLDTWIKNTLLPSMQNIVSGAAIGVLNVVTVAKNLIIGIIVALNAQIVCLSPSQWVNCFLEMLEVVPEKFHPS